MMIIMIDDHDHDDVTTMVLIDDDDPSTKLRDCDRNPVTHNNTPDVFLTNFLVVRQNPVNKD